MNDDYIDTGRKAQKEKTRQKILKSAQTLIEKGTDFSFEDVAKEANISRATVYRYYSNLEILAIEAGLDINTLSPKAVMEQSLAEELTETILNIQSYYNQLSLDHESSFRKYLSAMLSPSTTITERGARRVKSLSLALENKITALSEQDRAHLIHTATVLMGIEALIVTKDVCGLSAERSKETLRWGLTQVLSAVFKQSS